MSIEILTEVKIKFEEVFKNDRTTFLKAYFMVHSNRSHYSQ